LAPIYTDGMVTRTFDPSRLDVVMLATDGSALQGEWPADELPRLLESALPMSEWMPPPAVRWELRGRLQPKAGSAPEVWLNLVASCRVALTCQRCLQTVHESLHAERDFLFVSDEAHAQALDDELEADVLVISRAFDAKSLVEDELILTLPLVPRHLNCAFPAGFTPEDEVSAPADNPFAALANLKLPPQ
jgi:uncharacterized protein